MLGGIFYNSSGVILGISFKEMERKNFDLLLEILVEIYGLDIPESLFRNLEPENKVRLRKMLDKLKNDCGQ